jgi:hypothetical protein
MVVAAAHRPFDWSNVCGVVAGQTTVDAFAKKIYGNRVRSHTV